MSRRLAGVFGSLAALACGRDAGHAEASATPSQRADTQKAPRCHAGWPMPNIVGAGLPNRQSFDTRDPGVVRDEVTGLSWQRAVDADSYDLAHAVGYCTGLTLGGHRDWRLPAMIELASIADTSQADPAADPIAFANTPAVPFWSSQKDITNSGLGWYVFFKSGGVFVGNDVLDPARVRCVRGASSCGDDVGGIYSLAGDLAHDAFTKLTWQRAVAHDNFTWEGAKSHCETLDSNGGGWRLPSLRELLTLVDVTRVEPATDTLAFPDTPSEFFWSSSPSSAPVGSAWGVNFTRGSSGAGLVATKAHVRCTR
jgi:hypothetical protein